VKWRNAIWQALAVWTVALAIAGLAMLVAFIATAHAQSRLDNLVSGSASATTTAATQIIAAPSATRRIYVTAIECGRTDTGSSAISVALNDNATTTLVLPNSGGGGGSNATFSAPLTVPAATALTFAMSSNTSTIYCNAQGFTGN
jgi:hypothetical protein